MKVTGLVKRSDLEGGHWTITVEGGETYQLVGDTTLMHDLEDGLRAEIHGKVEQKAMGIGMTGPHFKVSAIKTL